MGSIIMNVIVSICLLAAVVMFIRLVWKQLENNEKSRLEKSGRRIDKSTLLIVYIISISFQVLFFPIIAVLLLSNRNFLGLVKFIGGLILLGIFLFYSAYYLAVVGF